MSTRVIEHADRSSAPGGLGRHVFHDERSRRYAHKPSTTVLASKIWPRNYSILDQGVTGSCTGNAMTGAVYTGNVFTALTDALKAKYPATESTARDVLYHLATTLDSYDGTYPPADSGSDGVSVSKAAQQIGLVSGYRHTFSVDDALATLSADSHVITGVNWYSSFDTPDVNGLVKLGKRAQLEGGHEFLLFGVDATNELVLARNSWGTSWGAKANGKYGLQPGEFAFSFTDFGTLLKQDGDVTVPVPLSAPAPTPTPVDPGEDGQTLCDEIQALADKAIAWIKAHV